MVLRVYTHFDVVITLCGTLPGYGLSPRTTGNDESNRKDLTLGGVRIGGHEKLWNSLQRLSGGWLLAFNYGI